MTLTEVSRWVLAMVAGCLLGGFYFYGLWWTLGRWLTASSPNRWLAISYGVRTGVVLFVFGFFIRTDLIAFGFTLAGFFLMRMVLTRVLGRPDGDPRPKTGSENA
jgi:F1F0 ATPase subunit 2